MDSNQQAIDKALDDLEIENEPVVEKVVEVDDPLLTDIGLQESEVVKEVEPVDDPKDAPKENPPGYIDNLEDWVAAGKDPKLFKSPELYSAEYERIQENKALKETMVTLTQGLDEWKEQQKQTMATQLEQAKIDAVADLEQAKEDDNLDAAIEAQKKIGDLDKPPQETYKPNPVLTDFYSKNPILDKNNSQFDEEVFQDTSMFQSVILDKLTGGDKTKFLTPSQIERSLKLALQDAKALSPDKFVSPRNKRKAAPSTPRTNVQQKGGNYTTRLKSVKSNTMNRHDTGAANEMYEMLKAKANKVKDPTMKEKALAVAETYAKNVLGD